MDLNSFFAAHPRAALAFSGGVDSAFLLYTGLARGAEIRPFFIKTLFQPRFEMEDAMRFCRELGVELRILQADVLSCPEVRNNQADRCYHCKRVLLGMLRDAARNEGYSLLLDGSNASDDESDRPGTRALEEFDGLSPLRLCGLTKPEIRRLSQEAGRFTWNKPAYACLATRVQSGEVITAETLHAVEESESFLFSLGFSDFRVRTAEGNALLQFVSEQLSDACSREDVIRERLSPFFHEIRIDPAGRKPYL